MALELQYLGQNVSLFGPNLALTGDPSLDNPALQAAGYVAGTIVGIVTSATNPDGVAIAPLDPAGVIGVVSPFGAIITEPGEFANTIGPSASNRISVARQHFIGNIYAGSNTTPSYDTSQTYVIGNPLFVGSVASQLGMWTNQKGATGTAIGSQQLGICTHAPTTIEPWLGVASLF
jgi:hypothetical protein